MTVTSLGALRDSWESGGIRQRLRKSGSMGVLSAPGQGYGNCSVV